MMFEMKYLTIEFDIAIEAPTAIKILVSGYFNIFWLLHKKRVLKQNPKAIEKLKSIPAVMWHKGQNYLKLRFFEDFAITCKLYWLGAVK